MIVGDNIYCLNVLLMNSDVYMSNVSNLCVIVLHASNTCGKTILKEVVCFSS